MEKFILSHCHLRIRHEQKNGFVRDSEFFSNKVFSLALLIFFTINLNAATYYLKNGTEASNRLNWTTVSDETGSNPSNFTTKGDVFIVEEGETGYVSANWTVGYVRTSFGLTGNTWNLNINGTLTIKNSTEVTIQSGTYSTSNFNVNAPNGKLIIESSGQISFSGGNLVYSPRLFINDGATLVIANSTGINGSIGTGTLLARVFSTAANYEFNGTDQVIAGLPILGVNNLTLSNSGSKTLEQNTTVNGTLLVQDNVSLVPTRFR